jgi:hypothetical protein
MATKVHGLERVRLSDIGFDERMKAARIAARSFCKDEGERDAVLLAALVPSDNVYWIRRQAMSELDELAAA